MQGQSLTENKTMIYVNLLTIRLGSLFFDRCIPVASMSSTSVNLEWCPCIAKTFYKDGKRLAIEFALSRSLEAQNESDCNIHFLCFTSEATVTLT